jgi:hypothetical protein
MIIYYHIIIVQLPKAKELKILLNAREVLYAIARFKKADSNYLIKIDWRMAQYIIKWLETAE